MASWPISDWSNIEKHRPNGIPPSLAPLASRPEPGALASLSNSAVSTGSPSTGLRQQLSNLRSDVLFFHQRFSHQNCICSGATNAFNIVHRSNSTFGNEQDARVPIQWRTNSRGDTLGSPEVHLEGFQIAIIDADDSRSHLQSAT